MSDVNLLRIKKVRPNLLQTRASPGCQQQWYFAPQAGHYLPSNDSCRRFEDTISRIFEYRFLDNNDDIQDPVLNRWITMIIWTEYWILFGTVSTTIMAAQNTPDLLVHCLPTSYVLLNRVTPAFLMRPHRVHHVVWNRKLCDTMSDKGHGTATLHRPKDNRFSSSFEEQQYDVCATHHITHHMTYYSWVKKPSVLFSSALCSTQKSDSTLRWIGPYKSSTILEFIARFARSCNIMLTTSYVARSLIRNSSVRLK